MLLGAGSLAAQVTTSHAIGLREDPKHQAGFDHFDYVNPDAPKGGTIQLSAIGTYDNFNRYASRGVTPNGIENIYDSLLVPSNNEVEVYYGLIAEQIEYPADHSWVIFHINPEATHHDGEPITAEDVVFSFNKFLEEGVSQFSRYYSNVENVRALDRHRVRFDLKEGDREMIINLGTNTILPKHYWESRDLSQPQEEVPLGNGPYRISDYEIGSYVVYERVDDYWANDLNVNRGKYNFEHIRYEYYRDQTVALQAFKSGEYDFRRESVARNWATQYTGPAFRNGHIVKEELPHDIPPGMQGFVFNTSRSFFEDRRVRRGIAKLFDFQWMNKNLFYGQYTRTRSFFENTKYAATGTPSQEQLEILRPLRDGIPPQVFDTAFQPTQTDGSGNIRPQMREALRLFRQAGWELQDQKLVNTETGEQMQFQLLLYSPSFERVASPFQDNLERVGIDMEVRVVDTTQFINRLREGDYDMVPNTYGPHFYPSSSLRIEWDSEYLESTYNTARLQDPEVDKLIEGIMANQDNPDKLVAYGRALDRVLTWEYYVIPQWHISKFRVAYWDKFSRPEERPSYALGLDTWWVDEEKADALPNRN
jgi:microcin C transport system substrate-binding protein